MTVEKILQTIHRIYEGDTNYPTSGEDFDLRIGLINDAIHSWEQVENTRWKELIVRKTGTTSESTIACPVDFVEPLSPLKIGNAYYSFLKPEEASRLILDGSADNFFWVSGKPGSYILNVNPTPEADLDYEYWYYKNASEISSTSDIPEVPNPMYIVYFVLARLYELDNQNDKLSFYEQKAFDALGQMIISNEVKSADDNS